MFNYHFTLQCCLLTQLFYITGIEKPSQDVLNCGVCKKAFPLQDITAFIPPKATHSQEEGGNNSYQRSFESLTVSISDTVKDTKER